MHGCRQPENLLFKGPEEDAELILVDFGFAREIPTGPKALQTPCFTEGLVTWILLLLCLPSATTILEFTANVVVPEASAVAGSLYARAPLSALSVPHESNTIRAVDRSPAQICRAGSFRADDVRGGGLRPVVRRVEFGRYRLHHAVRLPALSLWQR